MNGADPVYLDTSALLPYYREEPLSSAVEAFLLELSPPVLLSDLTRVEFASAVARWVRRGEISEAQAGLLEDAFWQDQQAGLYTIHELKRTHFARAERWLMDRKTSLRALDALHLACCWEQNALLVTCDSLMHGAASQFGLKSRVIK